MKILIVGDIFSKLGRESFERNLKKIREEHKIHFIIVNGENTTHGRGLNEKHFKWFLSLGVHVITLGNHSYHNKTILEFIDTTPNLIRPYNFPDDAPGKGITTINYNGMKITVFQMIGMVFMAEGNFSPFEKTEELLQKYPSDLYICDFHAEATSEKIAFGHYFDGRIQIIFGTHTHVPTHDARLLPKGSAYITDVGMTGPLDGIIGMKKEIIINRYLHQSKAIFTPENEGKSQFNAVLVEVDDKTYRPLSIKSIQIID
ncbi:MAG: TIGR00282 family metallophosphoesterase [Bacilli bacterium]